MINPDLNELEVAPAEVVGQMVEEFAAALAETREFLAWEQASEALRRDAEAQHLAEAFNRKLESLRALRMLDSVSPEDGAELERLQRAFHARPSVMAHTQAQQALSAICQATAAILSAAVGFNWSAVCGPSCCG